MFYCFDVETSALPESEIGALAPDFAAPSNWKDEAKIAAEVARKRAEWLQEAALSAISGEVVAVGIKPVGGAAVLMMGAPEPELLTFFWGQYDAIRAVDFGAKFVGFCSNRFDVPFLLRRSWKHGLPTPDYVLSGFYLNDQFMDVAKRWQAGNYQDSISLDRLARFLGVGAKEGDSAHFAQLLKEHPEKAAACLENHLLLTELCAARMGMLNR